MPKQEDPFYNRKPVPNEFIEHIGYTELTPGQEAANRERKYSRDNGDLRKFSNPKAKGGKLDPFYQRKPVSDADIAGVGVTGLSKEDEFLSRERKYSASGVDVRKFGDSAKSGFHPTQDPFYGRKPVAKAEIDGVGDTNMTRAEEFEVRENKASLFDLSSDPFAQITGSGHRASVSGMAGPAAAAAARRRSSAVAPHHAHDETQHHHHSGYDGDQKLAPVESRTEPAPTARATDDEIRPSTEVPPHNTTTTTTGVHSSPNNAVNTGHTNFYDEATRDLDSVAPHEVR